MDRIVGIETEYGCLLTEDEPHVNCEVWPAKVKNYLFRKADAGTIDLHYRDYEEPPGNGGFLLNGGRLYLDMGHVEYASPECLHLHDLVTYEVAGDDLLQSALIALGAEDRVSFIKNNVDHHTGATFGCHENYLMRREAQFTPPILGTLLTFLATRQIFTGAGRVGQSNPLAFDFEPPQPQGEVKFQLSQRADHIVNDIYQWVQFNRAIINARDEPLADYRKYRRLHLLIGDSNMSPYATALKIGTTACVLSLLEEGRLARNLVLADAVQSTRDISRDPTEQWIVRLENGKTASALDVQWEFHQLAQNHLHTSAETNWLLENWGFVLESIANNRLALIGGVDWITKKWLLERFIESEGLNWDDPWLESIDLEYHNIDPRRGLFFGVTPGKRIAEWNNSVHRANATHVPPANTRASGRSRAVSYFQNCNLPYVINWDSIACDSRDFLVMGNPFDTYNDEVDHFLSKPRTTSNPGEQQL
ncbi:MAG TPA: proteasome accessory factor PafA2 family protein [Candidatus Udaeobacter sp.]|jgi:proteasome accessory factor A|nr:proteasome accessory factor PafA2 family protein [Candidatus Udaeobacter sp.]